MAGKGAKARVGEVYLLEASDRHALIISAVGEDGSIEYLKTNETEPERAPADSNPLEGYVLATPERLRKLVVILDENREIAQHESDFRGADFLRICCALIRAYCDESFSKGKDGRFSEKPSGGAGACEMEKLDFRCEYFNCSFQYPKGHEGSEYKFLSCPNAEPTAPLMLKCLKSQRPCRHFHGAP